MVKWTQCDKECDMGHQHKSATIREKWESKPKKEGDGLGEGEAFAGLGREGKRENEK